MLMNIYNRFIVTTIQTICTHNLITRFTKNKLQKKKKQQRRSEQFNLKLQLLINVTKTNVQNPSYNDNMINDNNGMWYQSL